MASIKQNDVQITNNSNPETHKGQPLNLNQTKNDSSNIANENDRNSNLSPSKSADPARKKTFKIISVKKGGSGSGDLPGDNDGDSIDGLDESQTEDLSSEFYDSSKATDLDMDLPDSMMPLTPDEVTSTTTIVVKQKPDRDSQSRFKVVKIETKEPFRRGKWVCYDYFDTTPASVVTLEKNGSKMTEDSILHSALSGNLSSSSSVHYVQDVNDSSSNIYVTPFAPISPTGADGQHLFSDVFVPIPLAPPASQVLNPGLSSADVTPFIAQQVFMSMAGVPSSSTSFYSVAQPGQTTIIQSLPPTNVFPYAQNGPSTSLFQNGVAGQSNVLVNLPPDPIIASASVIPAVIPPMQPIPVADITAVSQDHGPGYVIVGGIPPRSQSQTQISGVPVVSQVLPPVIENGQSLPAVGISNATNVTYSSAETASAFSGLEVDQMGPGMDESTGSIKTLQGDPEGDPPQGLEEAVEAIHTGLEGNDEDADESGGSTVAIDNKIEQAMDLVKRHLMYAVREEVEILKQQIGEMMERIGQLEYENTVLRAEAKPETLNKLLLPRVTQAQPTSALPAPTSAAPALQQGQPSTSAQACAANHNTQNVAPQSQTQIHVQPPAQPVPQQQVQPTPGPQGTHAPTQAGHPPST